MTESRTRFTQWFEPSARAPKGSPKERSPSRNGLNAVWGNPLGFKLTNDIKSKPVVRLGNVDRLRPAHAEIPELLQEQVHILMHHVFLVPQGPRAEGMGEGLALRRVHGGVPHGRYPGLVSVVGVRLEEPLLARDHVAVNVAVGLDGCES